MGRASEVQKLIEEHGTEAALLLLTQEGYLRWAENKEIREQDINYTVIERLERTPIPGR